MFLIPPVHEEMIWLSDFSFFWLIRCSGPFSHYLLSALAGSQGEKRKRGGRKEIHFGKSSQIKNTLEEYLKTTLKNCQPPSSPKSTPVRLEFCPNFSAVSTGCKRKVLMEGKKGFLLKHFLVQSSSFSNYALKKVIGTDWAFSEVVSGVNGTRANE